MGQTIGPHQNQKKPMKIALIADIHANFPALQTVLADAAKQKVDLIWNLGDFVGHTPFPEEVAGTLRALKIPSIVGNYDLKVLDFPKNAKKWKKEKGSVKFFSFAWTYKQLSAKSKKYLRSLPQELRLKLGGKKFLLVHGSPAAIDDPLAVDTPQKKFLELSRQAKADVVLCGHTHRYFIRRAGGVVFINPGSVGRPFDGNLKTSYAIISLVGKKMKVINRRLGYPVAKTLAKMVQENFPTGLIESIALGRSMDDLKKILNKV